MSKLKTIREIEMEKAAQSNFGKGISVASGFDLGAKAPLDSRLTVKTIEERNAHVTGNRAYEGMLVYVEADKKTYQLIDNAWVDKNTEQDDRIKALEDLVVGGEGEGLESVISDVAANKAAIAKEITDREAAVSAVDGKIDAEVTRATAAEETLKGRLDVVQGTEEVEGSIAKSLADAKAYTNAEIVKIDTAYKAADAKVLEDAKADTVEKVNAAKSEVNGKIDGLTGRVTTAEEEITKLKDSISNKNSNTIVVETEAEIATANANPKVGDLAFVISSKRAYIYKGVEAVTAKNAPEGWVVFDEITNELDLVDYLKKSDAETTYRKITDKIAEGDLSTELSTKINNKLDASQVDEKISTAITPVSTKVDANEKAITKEITDRQGEITRVEGLVTAETTARTEAINSAKQELNSSVQGVDNKLTQRIDKFVPVISNTQPENTETGHVWLEILGE